MWLKDTRILDKIQYDVFKPGIQNPQPRVRHNKPLILQQLGIIMIILLLGLFIATLVFLVELSRKQKLNNVNKVEDQMVNTELQDTLAKQQASSVPIVIID